MEATQSSHGCIAWQHYDYAIRPKQRGGSTIAPKVGGLRSEKGLIQGVRAKVVIETNVQLQME